MKGLGVYVVACALAGIIMIVSGYDGHTWNYWAVIACMILARCSGCNN